MTCIAAVHHDGVVYMGADSMVTCSDGRRFHCAVGKLFTLESGVLVGASGAFREEYVFRSLELRPRQEGEDPLEYLTATVPEGFRAALVDAGALANRDGVDRTSSSFLIAYCGELCELDDTLTLFVPQTGYYGVGTGAEVAHGSLHSTQSTLSPFGCLQAALRAAEFHRSDVAAPFQYGASWPDGHTEIGLHVFHGAHESSCEET